MEDKNQVFNIPIEEYEEDMELSEGKKKEITELFTNHNHLHSQYEFNDIKLKLYEVSMFFYL